MCVCVCVLRVCVCVCVCVCMLGISGGVMVSKLDQQTYLHERVRVSLSAPFVGPSCHF